MSIRHYLQAFRTTLQIIRAQDGVYIKSENIITYEPDRIISEIPDNGLVTKQNAQDLISGSVNLQILEIIIPVGSPNPYTVIPTGFGTYLGVNKYTIIENPSDPTDKTDVQEALDIVISSKFTDNTYVNVDHYTIFLHDDPDNPGTTIDEALIIFYKI